MRVWIVSLAGITACLLVAYALSAEPPRRGEAPAPPDQAAKSPKAADVDREGPGERPAPGPGPGRRPGGPEARQPGPPPGPDGPPRRPGPPGPGQRPGPPPPFGGPRGPQENWASLEKNDPEMYKLLKNESDLERQTHELAAQYRQASKDQRNKIKEELQTLVTQQFEARQQRRTLELQRLEDELKRLRDAVDRREKARRELIDKRVLDLLGDEGEAVF